MNWPRGKHNGLRIVGVRMRVEIDLADRWWYIGRPAGDMVVAMGPFHVWLGWKYGLPTIQ